MKLKNKFSLIPLVCNVVPGCSKKNRAIIRGNALTQKKKGTGSKFNPGLALNYRDIKQLSHKGGGGRSQAPQDPPSYASAVDFL